MCFVLFCFQDKLGEIVFVQLPDIGAVLESDGQLNIYFSLKGCGSSLEVIVGHCYYRFQALS